MSMSTMPTLTGISARSYSIPTSSLEADGTIAWNHTTMVVVKVKTNAGEGIGYTYASQGAETIIKDSLWLAIGMRNLSDIPACWQAMRQSVRNIGQPGLASSAIAAVDIALWDIKAKFLNVPLAHLLGKSRDSIEVYGSGGFTTYGPAHIRQQIEGWAQNGIRNFKIKIGKEDETDHQRIDAALQSLPDDGNLLVDANGAYHPKQALAVANYLADYPVTWFEEPVSSDDIPGLQYMRQHCPPGMDIAAGEYAYTLDDARRLLENSAVDVLQIDATRAQGVTGFLNMAAQAEAFHRPISAHCAPAIHIPLCCNATDALHLEYFWDHARIEKMAFDGVPEVVNGHLTPHEGYGLGITLREQDIEEYAL